MTNKQINEAVAQRLGYEKVKGLFGNPVLGTIQKYGWKIDGKILDRIPNYCGDIAAAWGIWSVLMEAQVGKMKDGSYDALVRSYKGGRYAEARASTAPMAICLAFLKLP